MRRATVSCVMSVPSSVRPYGTTRLPLDKFLCNLIFKYFFWKKNCREIKVTLKSYKINGTLDEDQYLCFTTSRSFLLRMRKFSDKLSRGNQNLYFVFKNIFSKIVSFIRERGKNIVERGRSQMTIWRMRIACWIPQARSTHSQYVILIAFPP